MKTSVVLLVIVAYATVAVNGSAIDYFYDSMEDSTTEKEIPVFFEEMVTSYSMETTDDSGTTVGTTVMPVITRIAIDAPEICGKGEVKIRGACRELVSF